MAKESMAVHYIMTGGTIDSHYDGGKDTVVPNQASIIPSFITSLKLYSEAKFTEVCMKDSRDLAQEDLENLLTAVEKSSHKKIIITHGTYTMPDTSRFLKGNLQRKDQVVILTASLTPISGFCPSDGPFNLGYALAQLEHLKPGIYVCVNGKVFAPEEVVKMISEARFTSIFQQKRR